MTKKARIIIELLKAAMQGSISYSGCRTNEAIREYNQLVAKGIINPKEMEEDE